MKWIKVADSEKLSSGERQIVKVEGRAVLVINHEGELFAMDNSCPHWGLPLQIGRVTDDCGIVCPWHHSAFDLRTGDVKAWSPWPPGLGRVLGATSRRKALRVFPTRIEDDSIWIGVEE